MKKNCQSWRAAISGAVPLIVMAGSGCSNNQSSDIRGLEAPSIRPTSTPAPPRKLGTNAFDYYANAGEAVVDNRQVDQLTSELVRRVGAPQDLTRARALLVQNAKPLELLRRGFAYEYRLPPEFTSPASLRPHLSKFRSLARLLRFEGQFKAAGGDWQGAANSDLDAVRLGTDIVRNGGIIDMLVGVACQAIGQADLWAVVDHLDAKQARAALQRLVTIETKRVPYADVLRGEKASTARFSASIPKSDPSIGYVQAQDRALEAAIADARLPYAARKRIVRPVLPQGRDSVKAILALPPDQQVEYFQSTFVRSGFNEARIGAQSTLLLVALALRAYEVEKGAYPAALTALVPAYLQKLPDDPFAPNGPLRYKPPAGKGGKYVLYSIGPDGRDDGGKPIEDSTRPLGSRARYVVQQTSTGDIVAGIESRMAAVQSSAPLGGSFSGAIPPGPLKEIVATSEKASQIWKYTFIKPAAGWSQKAFNDADWKKGPGGFGVGTVPGSPRVGTPWRSRNIWLRRTFNLGNLSADDLTRLLIRDYHDEDVEVFINGVLAYKSGGYIGSYEYIPLSGKAKRSLVLGGENVMAVSCHQSWGGQYIDVGISQRLPAKR